MDLATIIADATAVISLGKLAVQVGEDAAPYVETAYAILVNGEVLTPAQRAANLTAEASLRARLNAAQPGDPT